MTTDYSEWDDFIKDSEKDTRLGKHEFQVTSVVADAWNDGSPRYKLKGILLTAGNAKADMTISPPPTLEEAKLITDNKRKRGIALSVTNLKALSSYGKTLDTLAEGDVLNVETGKQPAPDGVGYFIRVVRILSKDAKVGGVPTDVKRDNVPF